jgi:predicted RNase H-like nuclease
LGIDLAWSDRNRDGLARIVCDGSTPRVESLPGVLGNAELLRIIDESSALLPGSCVLAIDAPIICPNSTGSRPVDRLTHQIFHREHAGCHPSNSTRCRRPFELGHLLKSRGFVIDWELDHPWLAFEVYPHPATIRFFGLSRILKYKRGAMDSRRAAFAELQRLIRGRLSRLGMVPDARAQEVLSAPWTKPTEDAVDAILCGLIGWNHWAHAGTRSEILGDRETGFLVIPKSEADVTTKGRFLSRPCSPPSVEGH